MKNIIKLEEAAQFAVCLYALTQMQVDWWWYILLVIGPDIGMLGYLGGNRSGALLYNLFHHKAVAVILFIAGWGFANPLLQLTGITLFGHSSLDRMFGYGLKTSEGFKYTHLGMIGRN